MASVSTEGTNGFSRSLSDYQDELKKQSTRLRADLENEAEQVKQAYSKDLAGKIDEFSEEKKRTKDDESARYLALRESRHQEDQAKAEESYNRFGQFAKATSKDQERIREKALETEDGYKRKVETTAYDYNKKLERKEEDFSRRQSDRDYKAKTDKERSIDDLKNDNKNLSFALGDKNDRDGQRNLEKRMNEEKELNLAREALVSKFSGQIDNQKRRTSELEDLYGKRQSEVISAKERNFSKSIGDLNARNAEDKSQMKDEMELLNKQWQVKSRKQQATAENSFNEQMGLAAEARRTALTKQAQGYTEAMARSSGADADKITRLEKELSNVRTTSDPNDISPGAEAALSAKFTDKFGKVIDRQKIVDDKKIDAANTRYYRDVAAIRQEEQGKQYKIQADMMARSQEQHEQLNKFVSEHEERGKLATESREAAAQRKLEDIQSRYSRVFSEHRQKSDEAMELSKMETNAKIRAIHEDYQLEARKKERNYLAYAQDMIRGYEKKIADQRNEYEDIMAQMKIDAERDLKESEKKAKINLDDQARAYEHRIDQSNSQWVERERLVAQQHEDETERLRRTNALLLKKKA